MIIAAVCAMASVAQAYAFNWGAANVRIPVAKDVTVSQTGIQTTTDSAKFAQGALALSLFYVGADGEQPLLLNTKTTGEGALSSTKVFDFNDATYNAIIADTATSSGAAVDFVMRATYTTATGTYEFYQALDDVDITVTSTKNVSKNFNMNNGTWNYTANPIPEPTSGLLLLLGVAGLALRRRRA